MEGKIVRPSNGRKEMTPRGMMDEDDKAIGNRSLPSGREKRESLKVVRTCCWGVGFLGGCCFVWLVCFGFGYLGDSEGGISFKRGAEELVIFSLMKRFKEGPSNQSREESNILANQGGKSI